MPIRPRHAGAVALTLSGFALTGYLVGCGATGQTTWLGKKDEPDRLAEEVVLEEDPRTESAAVRDTIHTVAWLEGLRRMAVGGHGLVVGLGKNGTKQCPRPVREQMLQDMRRRYRLGYEAKALKHLTPENLLDSEGTAVVLVYGEIPAAAHKGTQFDLTVRALEGTDVRSLEGGWLLPCNLMLWSDGQPVEGRVLAEGAGQVFINPFGLKQDAPTKTNPRVGRVIGGGSTTKARRVRLVLTESSSAIASRLMYLINNRFGADPHKTADAVSPHVVDLRIPKAWRGSEPHFLKLLMHLYVPAAPSFGDLRLRELGAEALEPKAALDDISLAWEGMAKVALASIQKLYTHKDQGVSYYAARAGLRIEDNLALDVIARHANDPQSRFRELAVEELGRAKNLSRAVQVLRPLLDADDHRVRWLAYECLRRHEDPVIQSTKIGKRGEFVLDLVPCRSRHLITARRSGEQRLTLFGATMRCQTPVFYWHRNETVIITADLGATHLRLVRRAPTTGRRSEPITCPTSVAGLIGMLGRDPVKDDEGHYQGLGLTYSQVVEVLHDLCADKTIDATFVLQGPEPAEVAAPPSDAGRPESEL